MKDLDGKELEIGTIYYLLGSGTRVVIGRFSHETDYSFVFKPVRNITGNGQGKPILLSWKRIMSKHWSSGVLHKMLQVVKVSQDTLDLYAIT